MLDLVAVIHYDPGCAGVLAGSRQLEARHDSPPSHGSWELTRFSGHVGGVIMPR
jgi:hypothetical protein